MKGFDFENRFTQQEYEKFILAVSKREDYELRFGDHKTKMQVVIYGRKIDNGVWLPENYYWAVDTNDRRGGYSGTGSPFRIREMKTYPELIDFVYNAFNIERPPCIQTQLSFL